MSNQLNQLTMPRFIFGNPDHCTYCGIKPNQIDHVIPLTQYTMISRKEKDNTGIRTYCCSGCNLSLSDKYFATFADRLIYAKGEIMKKSRRYSNHASWSDNEIARLDYTLRTYVANSQLKIRELDEREAWQKSFKFWECIATLNGVRCLDESSPKYVQWVDDYFYDIFIKVKIRIEQDALTMP
jgi:hypothetical protein